eukprot:5098047-Prymnesium_polylepis.2
MVATYPSYMNETPDTKQSFAAIMGDTCTALRDVMRTSKKRKPLLSSATFQAVFTTLKHYIQAILVLHGALMLSRFGVDQHEQQQLYTKILVGVLYAIFYLCSAVGTRNSHKLSCLFHSDKVRGPSGAAKQRRVHAPN